MFNLTRTAFSVAALAGLSLAIAPVAEAAFIIEAGAGGKANANFSADNATVNSTLAGAGTYNAPGLTAGVPSVFSGEPYTYTYTPSVDGDNTTFVAGEALNGFAGLTASGLTAGGAGLYNVYHARPQSENNGDQPTVLSISVNGSEAAMVSVDFNTTPSLATGENIGFWELIGQVQLNAATDVVTVDIVSSFVPSPFQANPNFVGVRTGAVLFDAVPEPASLTLVALGAGLLAARRRR